jgi:hypothetical protein
VIGEARGGGLVFPDQHLLVFQQFKAVVASSGV